jgi:hypothetical protein
LAATHPPARAIDTSRGWLIYAGFLVMIGGALNIVWGVAAIDSSKFFVAGAEYVVSGLKTWGWVALIAGVAMIAAGFGIFRGSQWAVWIGIVALVVNAITQMLSISAYPWWSLALFALDLIALYALISRGLRFSR